MGLVSVVALAPSAFLASAAATLPLQSLLLVSASLSGNEMVGQVLNSWSLGGSRTAPVPPSDSKQSSWHSV